MSRDQQAARVNVSDDEWIEFRTLAMRAGIADYLGELVRRELDGSKRLAKELLFERSKRPRRRPAPRVRLAGRELLTRLPRSAPKPPPWES